MAEQVSLPSVDLYRVARMVGVGIKMSLLCQLEMTLLRDFRGVSGVTVRPMSDGELSRLEVLRDLDQRRLTTAAAAQLLGLGRRQVFRLLKAYRS